MSDPRFARLRTDPRFRKPRRTVNKVIVDDRFKSILEDKKDNTKGKGSRVDKYGRKVSASHDSDNLRRFYRLGGQEEEPLGDGAAPDFARGEALLESSDEEDQQALNSENDDSEVILGRDARKPIAIPEDEPEINLDESQFAELDALAAQNTDAANNDAQAQGEQTNRLAVVNLDWDHVRASHLFKIFSSAISLSGSSHRERERGSSVKVGKGKVLHVRVYPSEFGKKRLAQEEKEGPPKELFKKPEVADDNDDDDGEGSEKAFLEEDGNEYDEEALRKYQLERLRYYYAIVTCDTVETAACVYSELEGTELERSANMFDLSFVPNDMTFDEDFRDEATQDLSSTYKGVEFVTAALRHSKVKLTWDDDDPERNKITRRTLSRKDIEEADFKAYIASSGSSNEGSDADGPSAERREKMRALLLGGNDDDNELLPEGWGHDKAGDMEITFTPGLSGSKDADPGEDETTMQRYLRKQRDKRKKKKTESAEKTPKGEGGEDDFFGEDSEEDEGDARPPSRSKGRKSPAAKHVESTPAELELLLTSDKPSEEPKHFDMRSVIKAEKAGSKKRARKDKKKKGAGAEEDDAQEGFKINVKDDRFQALHEDHTFAIDPTNPQFKKTKSMAALLEERAKRQRKGKGKAERPETRTVASEGGRSLKSLVESVKRRSVAVDEGGGKRRKL